MRRLRALRKEYGMTMKELGEKIGVTESTISLYETGKRAPDFSTLIQFSKIFNVSIDYLLGNSDIKKEHTISQDDELAELVRDPKLKELYDILIDLDDEQLDGLLKYGEFLLQQQEENKKK